MAPEASPGLAALRQRLEMTTTELESETAAARVSANSLTEELAASRARGAVGTSRTSKASTTVVESFASVAYARVDGVSINEAEAAAAGADTLAEWKEAAAAGATTLSVDRALLGEVEASTAALAESAVASAAAAGKHTTDADLGGVTYGMSRGEQPIIHLDGLPWTWVISTELPQNVRKHMVNSPSYSAVPVGRKSHVCTLDTTRNLRISVQGFNDLIESCQGRAEVWETHPFVVADVATQPAGVNAADYVRPATASKAAAAGLSAGNASGVTASDDDWNLTLRILGSGTPGVSSQAWDGAAGIFNLGRYATQAIAAHRGEWEVFNTVRSDREKMAWRLTAYGVANVAAGEALATIIETDGFTAVASLADERYDLISLLERSVGAKRYLAVAQGRIFNPMAAAVASSPLNGHKTQNLAAYTRALGAPLGPYAAAYTAIVGCTAHAVWGGEVRVLNLLSADFHERVNGPIEGAILAGRRLAGRSGHRVVYGVSRPLDVGSPYPCP